ncbi:MAG: hypothetical protein J6A92_05180 [Lachnospiraceae bacterium]|nr:hypothetical protein [Lachnospiraceae bacterium]
MLEKRDVVLIKEVVEEVVGRLEVRMDRFEERMDRVEKRIDKVEKRINQQDDKIDKLNQKMEKRFTETENLILQYVDDTRHILEEKIDKVDAKVEEVKQYHKMNEQLYENQTLCFQLIHDLRVDVDKLKEKTA